MIQSKNSAQQKMKTRRKKNKLKYNYIKYKTKQKTNEQSTFLKAKYQTK